MTWHRRSSHKYNAVKVEIDGYKFDSKREARRYQELKLTKAKGLVVHPEWKLVYNGVKLCRIVLDFQYELAGREIFEDVKGVDTPVSRLKRKLLKAFYGIEVTVIK